ncbi:MAG: esterase, partial [Spirochaetae bacterium HGW-Spirochaetae-9]
ALPLSSLLAHSSGLPAIPALERHFASAASIDREKAIAALCSIQPERGPDEAVVYSCVGYMLLGLVLERLSGKLLGEFYRTEIAEPLGLPRATFAPGISPTGEPLAIEGAAPTEFCAWRGRRVRGQVHDESAYCLGGQAGNAGLFVSLEDVRATASLLLEDGTACGKALLGEESIAWLSHSTTEGLGERRTLGYRLNEPGCFMGPLWPASSLGHTGFTGTSLALSREKRMMAIILTNRVYYGREETMQKMADFRIAFHSLACEEFI